MEKKEKLPERPVPIQKIAEVLKMSESEVEELCENRKIPFHVTDPGTAWEAKRFYVEDVLKAVKPSKEKAEKEAAKEKAAKEKAEKEAAEKAKTKTEDPL